MRIVQIINTLDFAGAERVVVDLAGGLVDAGHDVHVAGLYRGGPLADDLAARGVPVSVAGVRREESAPASWRRMYGVLRRLRPDVVHTHLPESAWYSLPPAAAAGVRVRVSHMHNAHWYWSTRQRAVDRAMATFGTAFAACSSDARRYALERLHYPERKVRLILNAVDLTRFRTLPSREEARQALGLPLDATILLAVGALSEQKGHRHLIDAMPAVRAALPAARLLLAGSGELRGDLAARVGELGLGDAVDLLGRRDDVPVLLRAADVYVMPSLWEGLSIALLEAAAAGAAIVASDIAGMRDAVVDGETGALVPAGDSDALAAALAGLLRDPRRLEAMGTRARERALRDFDADRMVREVLALYERRAPTG